MQCAIASVGPKASAMLPWALACRSRTCARLQPKLTTCRLCRNFQDDDLVFHQRGNGDRLAAVLTQPHQVLTPHRQDVEPFAQLLAQ